MGALKIIVSIIAISLLVVASGYAKNNLSGPSSLKWAVNSWLAKHVGNKKNLKSSHTKKQQGLKLTAVSPVQPIPHTQTLPTSEHQFDPEGLFPKPDMYHQQAFQGVAQQAMPLTPAQIVQLKKMLSETQRASAAPAGTPPKPTVSTQVVSLAPGTIPPVVRLQQGFVTSVVFEDNTGADWPIDSYDLGNSRAFNIQVEHGSNAMMIQALNMYTYGNLAVKLKGLSTPVMVTLVPGQQVVDYRVDLHVQGNGPNANSLVGHGVPNAVNSTLLSVLNGIPPQGAKTLNIDDANSEAWLVGDTMYVRTNLIVLSPSWKSVVTSPDGTRAYEMNKSPTLLISENGKPMRLAIEGL